MKATSKAYDDAVSLYNRRRTDLAEAEALVKSIQSEWARGQDAHSALDLLAAKAEAERSTALIRSAELARRLAEGKIVNGDTSLALGFAPFAAHATPCESVVVTSVRPKVSEVSKGAALPVLYLVQAKATTSRHGMGPSTISGEIEAVLIRKATHRELDLDGAVNAADRSGWQLRTETGPLSMQDGELHEDSITIEVRMGFAELPLIPAMTSGEGPTKRYADDLARKAAAGMQRWDAPPVGASIGTGDASAISESVTGVGAPGTVVSVKIGPGGVREAVVTVQIVGFGVDPRDNPDRIVAQFSRTFADEVGLANVYFGRCVSAEVVGIEPRKRSELSPPVGRAVTARMVFRSQADIAAE